MDNSLQDSTQPISDDQELAKALAGIGPDEPEQNTAPSFPELPGAPALEGLPADPATPSPLPQPSVPPVVPTPAPIAENPGLDSNLVAGPAEVASAGVPTEGLDDIKKSALNELRPLVDRVNLAPEEKFDIYLMLIRSTDDTSLIAPAHTVAQSIEDEKKKAEALLDIIKEIDYLSRKDQKQQ